MRLIIHNFTTIRSFNKEILQATANAWANKTMIDHLGYNVYNVPEGEMLIGMNGRLNPNATLGRKYTRDGVEYYLQPDDWEGFGLS